MACKMAVNFFSKQSPETKPPQFYKVSPLNWLPVTIVINIVIGGEDLKSDWLMQLSNYRPCPITANCPITTLQIN